MKIGEIGLSLRRYREFWVHCGQHDEVRPYLAPLGGLFIHGPVSAQESDKIQKNGGNGDNGPAPTFIVLVAKWDE